MSLLKDIKRTKAYIRACEMHALLGSEACVLSAYLPFIHDYATKLRGVISASLDKLGTSVDSIQFDAEVGSTFVEFSDVKSESKVSACAEMLDIDFPRVSLKGYGEYDIAMHPEEILADIEEQYLELDAKCESTISVLKDAAKLRSQEKS